MIMTAKWYRSVFIPARSGRPLCAGCRCRSRPRSFCLCVGFWLIFAAINSVCEAFILSRHGWGWTILNIVLLAATIVFAFWFVTDPIMGLEAGWLWIGISFITFGCYRIGLAFMLKSINKRA